MNLRQALRVEGPARVALTGAGGKTTALFQLGEQMPGPVILTASTHLAVAQTLRAGRHVIVTRAEEVRAVIRAAGTASTLLLTGLVGGDGRTAGLETKLLEVLRTEAARQGYAVLVEADGSRRKPLKAPAEHEPAIPGWVDMVVVCAGLSALGRPLDEETVHRAEIFTKITGLAPGAEITSEAICAGLVHPRGGLKAIPEWARKVALLNQADTPALQETARAMAARLLGGGYDLVLVAALAEKDPEQQVKAACQRTAGIVLAAGGAQRFGQPKVLLEWQGQPLVRRAAAIALKAGLTPVRVVCGAEEAQVRRALEGLPVEIIANPLWNEGQSTSVAAGLRQLPRRTGAAIFLLADQPLVTAGILNDLTRRHEETLASIVAPRVNGRRANPVLFDQVCFGDLSQIHGDTGGRVLFERYPVSWLESQDGRLLFDIDTPEDYQRLLEMTPEEA